MDATSQTIQPTAADVYRDALELQRSISPKRDRPRKRSVLADPEPGLRIRLLRAGAAWLIGWASLLAMLQWVARR